MRIKRATGGHGDLAIRGAANADASALRCDACFGVMPASVGCLLRWDACFGGIAASIRCLAGWPPGTGFRRGREVAFVTRRLSLAVYAHKRGAWIARSGDSRWASGIPRCGIPRQDVPLTTKIRSAYLPGTIARHAFHGEFMRTNSAALSRGLPPRTIGQRTATRAATRHSHRRHRTQCHRLAHRLPRHPLHHPIESSSIVASFMRINR